MLTALAEEGGWDGLVVRSQTRVDAELLEVAAPRLSVIGVASVGTDRIDLAAATRAGVMVVNAPTGNTIAAAEHTMALMLALLRHVPAADASLRTGEWERGRFTGSELRHRTLGIIGLGKIGKAVARRANGFEMRVVAHDPYLTEEQAAEHGARLVGLPELLLRADVITVHTPLTPQTRGLIGSGQIDAMKPGAVLLNVARGRDRGRGGACLGPARRPVGRCRGGRLFVRADGCRQPVARRTQHGPDAAPGASTAEAQDRVAVEMAEQLLEALAGRDARRTPSNAPSVAPDVVPRLRPYVELGRRLAILARQLSPAAFDCIGLTYAGEIAEWDCAPDPHRRAGGILEAVTDQRVNAVNADLVARERGLTVRETRTDAPAPWTSLVTLEAGEGEGALRLAGSTAHGRPHVAGLGGFQIDAELAGLMLVTRHHDQPGIVGSVGTTLAEAGVNISSLELSRLSAAGEAMMVVSVDSPVSEEVLDQLRSVPGIREAQVVELPPLG